MPVKAMPMHANASWLPMSVFEDRVCLKASTLKALFGVVQMTYDVDSLSGELPGPRCVSRPAGDGPCPLTPHSRLSSPLSSPLGSPLGSFDKV